MSDDIDRGEQFQLTTNLVVVMILNIFQILKIAFQILFGKESSAMDTAERLIFLVATPISTGGRDKFESLYGTSVEQMGTATEVNKVVLLIDGDSLALGYSLKQFHLIRLIALSHNGQSLIAAHLTTFKTGGLLDDGLHLLLDCIEVLTTEGTEIEIIEEAIVCGRTDSDFSLWEKVLHSLSHDVCGGVAEHRKALLIAGI